MGSAAKTLLEALLTVKQGTLPTPEAYNLVGLLIGQVLPCSIAFSKLGIDFVLQAGRIFLVMRTSIAQSSAVVIVHVILGQTMQLDRERNARLGLLLTASTAYSMWYPLRDALLWHDL